MKYCLTIILFLNLLFQSFSKVLIVADYQLRKSFIAANICENRDKPKMHCNGKCHLKKQLQKDQDKSGSKESNKQLEKFELLFYAQIVPFEEQPVTDFPLLKHKFPVFTETFVDEYSGNIFHPPLYSCFI